MVWNVSRWAEWCHPELKVAVMHNQRGMSLSPFVVILLPALLVVIGLVVDGGAQAAAARHAERVAAFAARAGTDAAAGERLSGGTQAAVVAISAARQALAQDPDVTGSVTVVDGAVEVRTQARAGTKLLNLIGIDELSAEGFARADLAADR